MKEGQPIGPERYNRLELFITGFVFGAFLGFLEALFFSDFTEAIILGIICGIIIGSIAAIWGKHALDFLIEFISR